MRPSHDQLLLANRLKIYNLIVRKLARVDVWASLERGYRSNWAKFWSKIWQASHYLFTRNTFGSSALANDWLCANYNTHSALFLFCSHLKTSCCQRLDKSLISSTASTSRWRGWTRKGNTFANGFNDDDWPINKIRKYQRCEMFCVKSLVI